MGNGAENTNLPRLWSRRQVLLAISAMTASVAGCRRRRSQPSLLAAASLETPAFAATMPACVVRSEQTEGPYFVDEKLNRSDIRVDPSDKSVKAGVPLRLEFHVSRIAGGNCMPLSGAIVDVWHCDALGVYSDVHDVGFDTRGSTSLDKFSTVIVPDPNYSGSHYQRCQFTSLTRSDPPPKKVKRDKHKIMEQKDIDKQAVKEG